MLDLQLWNSVRANLWQMTSYEQFRQHFKTAALLLYVWQGCEQALRVLQEHFPDMEILSLSGNFCTDKKSSAVNWWQLITYLLTYLPIFNVTSNLQLNTKIIFIISDTTFLYIDRNIDKRKMRLLCTS